MNDTQGCYDRIDHTFAILVLMFFGIPWRITRNCFRPLQQGRHRIKTGYGLSKPVNGNEDPEEPIAGIGQGNSMCPSLWCLMSSVIIKDCKRNGHGTTIITAISRKIASILGFAFVDNADLTTAASNAHTSVTEMIHKMHALMTHWCGCIRAIGGYIAPVKTRWFLISFFLDGNWLGIRNEIFSPWQLHAHKWRRKRVYCLQGRAYNFVQVSGCTTRSGQQLTRLLQSRHQDQP